jgi:uncharacterized protein YecE (DUF72 family)
MSLVPRTSYAPPARLFAETSCWAYSTWKPGFYPDSVSPRKQLTALAERLSAVAQDREVSAYFKHEDEPTGAFNAMAFLKSAAKRTRRAGK